MKFSLPTRLKACRCLPDMMCTVVSFPPGNTPQTLVIVLSSTSLYSQSSVDIFNTHSISYWRPFGSLPLLLNESRIVTFSSLGPNEPCTALLPLRGSRSRPHGFYIGRTVFTRYCGCDSLKSLLITAAQSSLVLLRFSVRLKENLSYKEKRPFWGNLCVFNQSVSMQ